MEDWKERLVKEHEELKDRLLYDLKIYKRVED